MKTPAKRHAAPTNCRGCGTPVVNGYDADIAAVVATVDPYLLTYEGELAAVADGRHTYALIGRQLHARLSTSGPSRFPVVADHCCGRPVPPGWREPLPAPTPRPDPTEVVF